MGEKEEKKIRITELAVVVGVLVSILVAATSLLSNSGNLPLWWFDFSFIALIILIFSMPIMIFAHPIHERIRRIRLERKKDSVSRKYSSEFKNLVERSRKFSYDIRDTMDSLRNHYTNEIKSQLAMFSLQFSNQQEIDNISFDMEKEIDESHRTFHELNLTMKRFELVLKTYTEKLRITEAFVHEIMTSTDKPIAKGIEANFEAFREKYNDFIKDFGDFCRKVNQESGSYFFPEHSFEYLKKW